MRQISMCAPDIEKAIQNIYNSQFSGTNDENLKRAKKAMVDVIRNDLTKRQKQIVLMYYYEELNITEIAERLDVNISTVSRTLKRARKNIFDRIKYYFY